MTAPLQADNTAKFGYAQELRPSLRLFSLFAISFSIISITTGIFLNYGFGLENWGPASIWLWPAVGLGQLVVALVVAELGTRIPLAGYAYQWSSRLTNSTYGWFVGFAGLLYMTVGGGAIMLLAAAPLLLSEFGVDAPSGSLLLTVAILLMVLPIVVNIISVQVAARVNNIAVFTEIAGTVVFGVLLLVLWGLHTKSTTHGIGVLRDTTNLTHHPMWYALALASLIGAYTLVGFELAADLSEDAVNARVDVPRAVIRAVGAAAALGMLALIGFTLAIPNVAAIEKSPLPLVDIASYWLGGTATKVFIAFVVFSMFALVVVGAGAQARLVYSLARDNMLPCSGALRRIDPRTRTPIVALIVFGAISIGLMIYGHFSNNAFGTLVAATAILPYIIYFMITLAYAFKRRTLQAMPGAFDLGRWAPLVIGFVLVWTALMMVILSVPGQFHGAGEVVLGGAAVATIWYIIALRGRLRRGTAGVRPLEEMLPAAESAAPPAVPAVAIAKNSLNAR